MTDILSAEEKAALSRLQREQKPNIGERVSRYCGYKPIAGAVSTTSNGLNELGKIYQFYIKTAETLPNYLFF